ncbi:MAG: metal ABC transporter permease [Acidocella sp.]|nr:metal ABC transporter permease [Acidocella sp.]
MFSGFMLNSWAAATMLAIVAGMVGFFVVIRGASFAAHALPLGTFPGAAAAGLAGVNPFWGLVGFALLGVAGISRLGRRQRADVATALTLITLLGVGTLCLSLSGQYAASAYALLFGQLLGVSRAALLPVGGICAGICALVLIFFRPLLLSAISPELAVARGVHAGRVELLFLALLGLATAMALPVVGALLVFSLLVGPPACARALTTRPGVAMALSVVIALVVIWAAIALSYESDWPIGFFVGALAAGAYGLGRAAAMMR